MMMCLKDMLLYVVLLPIPSASPLLVGLYWLAVILSIRPCVYCIAFFIIVFLTTSPSSPFLDIPRPQLPLDPLRPLTSPLPDRSWLTWNNGRFWDPAITGYQEIAKAYNTTNDAIFDSIAKDTVVQPLAQAPIKSGSWWSRESWRASAVSAPSDPVPSVADPLPSNSDYGALATPLPDRYFDLRWADVGFVIDSGFLRSEEGMRWEIEDAKHAAKYARSGNWMMPKQPAKGVEKPSGGRERKGKKEEKWDSGSALSGLLGSW